MGEMASNLTALGLDCPSEESAVSGILGRVEQYIRGRTAEDPTDLLLVLRELLVNAITHGNGGDPSRVVRMKIADLGQNRFSVAVSDEGGGFEYWKLDTRIPENPRNVRRHGYLVIEALAKTVAFSNGGSTVTATVWLDRGCPR
jgi:anti-sigma regulatory factor (Ser/Thr protein kinase)